MFRDKWKNMFIGKTWSISYKWVTRVFLWRFLETSSRIALFTLVWINLGGVSVFVLLGLEMVYLFIICYGLGTLSASLIYVLLSEKVMTITYIKHRIKQK